MHVKTRLGSVVRWLLSLLFICSASLVNGRSSSMNRILTVHQSSSLPLDTPSFGVEHPEKQVHNENNEGNELVKLQSQIGSKPPRCQNKCNSCKPCEAVQVPAVPQSRKISRDPNTPSRHEAAGTQEYSNYKPMNWKCKCGDKLFNP